MPQLSVALAPATGTLWNSESVPEADLWKGRVKIVPALLRLVAALNE